MNWIQEFKTFAMRGNVLDMAVGIIIGAAFGKIVSSFVSDVIMPPIGVLLGGVDFKDLSVIIQEASAEQAAVVIRYGAFVQTIVDFLIIALAVFIAIKAINSLKKKNPEPEPPAAPPADIQLLTEIRDLLKKQNS